MTTTWTLEATLAYVALTGELHPDCLVPVWCMMSMKERWVSIPEYLRTPMLYLQLNSTFGHCCSATQRNSMFSYIELCRATITNS